MSAVVPGRVANVGTLDVGIDVGIYYTVTMGAEYSLPGKFVRLWLRKSEEESTVLFDYDVDESGMSIALQVLTVAIPASAVSVDDGVTTLGSVLSSSVLWDGNTRLVEFSIDFSASEGADIDYRIQGDFKIIGAAGAFTPTTNENA